MIDYDRTKEQLQIFLRMRLSLSLSLVAIPSSGFEEKKALTPGPYPLFTLKKYSPRLNLLHRRYIISTAFR